MDLRWQRPDKPNGFYGLKVSTDMMLNDNAVPKILIFIALKEIAFPLHFLRQSAFLNIVFVLLFSRKASYCVLQRTRLMQWTGLNLHHVTDINYNNLMKTCNPNWIR